MTILGVDMHIFWNCTAVIVLQLFFFLDSANYYVACWASLFLVKEDRHPDHTHDNHLSNYVTEESECTQIHFCSQVGILKCIMVDEQENQFYIPSMIKWHQQCGITYSYNRGSIPQKIKKWSWLLQTILISLFVSVIHFSDEELNIQKETQFHSQIFIGFLHDV